MELIEIRPPPREPGEHAVSYAFRMALEERRHIRKLREKAEHDRIDYEASKLILVEPQ